MTAHLAWALALLVPQQAADPIPIDAALRAFAEAKAAAERDGGRLWGRSLDGPLILVDPATRFAVASRADAEGKLAPRGGAFVGTLPASVGLANTAVTWAGVRWSMILWPSLAGDARDRARLLAHELFHRIQDELGFPMASPANAHLDGPEGRLWLRLEMSALVAALADRPRGAARAVAVEDAAVFRAHRRSLAPRAAKEEDALERNEGLAEYTGLKLCGSGDAELARLLANRLRAAQRQPSLVRSFAYETGPAYGLLLDAEDPGWRARLAAGRDLSEMLLAAWGRELSAELRAEAEPRMARHGGAKIREEETARDVERRARLAAFRARYVDGPLLVLPAGERLNYTYDPNTLQPFDGHGTVYPKVRFTDAWGALDVSGGALLASDFKSVTVPAPAAPDAAAAIAGPGWTLELAAGWRLAKGARAGDFTLAK